MSSAQIVGKGERPVIIMLDAHLRGGTTVIGVRRCYMSPYNIYGVPIAACSHVVWVRDGIVISRYGSDWGGADLAIVIVLKNVDKRTAVIQRVKLVCGLIS